MINTHPWVLEKFAVKARDYDEYIRMLRADRAAAAGQGGRGGREPCTASSSSAAGSRGLFAAKALRRAPVEVVVVDRTNHHLFQPLLYQVATGVLSEGDIAPPIRDVLRHQRNARVVLGEVVDVDVDDRQLTIDTLGRDDDAALRQPDRRDRRVAVVLRPRRVRASTRRG